MSKNPIRRPCVDETEHMTRLCLASKQSLGYSDEFMALCVDELTITPEKLWGGEFWAYTPDGIILGYVCLTIDPNRKDAEISSFFIDAAQRGGGIGRKLWTKILERADELELTRFHLTSEPLSTGFYEKLGFETIGEKPSGSITGRMLPKMEKILQIRNDLAANRLNQKF